MKRAGKQSGAAATATNRGEAVAKTATAPQAIPAKRKAAQLAVALAPKAAKRARADVTSTAVEEDVDDASSGDFSSGTESDDLDLTRLGGRDDASIDSDEDSGSDVDNINVDFECVGPSEIDFKSVRRLLEHYLPGEEATFDISSMAEAIIAETRVGTMVKIEGDLDVYAFATIIPIVRFQVSMRKQAIVVYYMSLRSPLRIAYTYCTNVVWRCEIIVAAMAFAGEQVAERHQVIHVGQIGACKRFEGCNSKGSDRSVDLLVLISANGSAYQRARRQHASRDCSPDAQSAPGGSAGR